MAKAQPRDDWPRTVEAFQAWHAEQPERWEFIAGRPWLMAPGSMRHSLIKRNVFRELDRALGLEGCEVLVDGPQIVTDEISAIPDVVVTCSPLDLGTATIPEPVIIVEVMSPTTERDDTGRKWWAYRKIPSLRHYIVVAQEERGVLVHTRAGDLWHARFVTEGDVGLDDPAVRLEVAAIYAGTGLAG